MLQLWELLAPELIGLLAKSKRKYDANYKLAYAKFTNWLGQLKNYRVLDPACGSGNFLFLGLKALKDIEHHSHLAAEAMGLDREVDLVTGPHNMLGIELNEYAAELARVTVWIGEIQWRLSKGYEFKLNPVLEPLDNIECRDALLTFVPDVAGVASGESAGRAAGRMPAAHTLRFLKSPPSSAPLPDQLASDASNLGSRESEPAVSPPGAGSDTELRVKLTKAVEADWPKASIVIGNPPFLGGSKKRRELGDAYFDALDTVFKGRVPGGADLVCYWFDKARKQLTSHGLGAAGLVATNSIRGGGNRKVLEAITQHSRIYEAWSDEGWVNDGAAVRVSLVCFGHRQEARLNGQAVRSIHADLTPESDDAKSIDVTVAKPLTRNAGFVFEGLRKDGDLDIDGKTARRWLLLPNPHGRSNSEVIKPLINGIDITRRKRDGWVIDFGVSMTATDASLFEEPFAHVLRYVKPVRDTNNDKIRRTVWWRFGRTGEQFRDAVSKVPRYINTPRVAKHRIFVWQTAANLPDTATVAITIADDTTFGILHSRLHELWSLRMGTSLEDRPRYTPTTCFETFPFPAGLTPQDTASQKSETLPDGSIIPAYQPHEANKAMVGLVSGATSKRSKTVERPVPAPPAPGLVNVAKAIASAAKHLNDLRENWLNPPDWTNRIPEVTPLGMTTSPYPDRIVAKPGFEKDLAERTLTKLYNARPAWLDAAHKTLDAAVAQAYGWADYTADMPDEEILKRLLAMNLERSGEQVSNGVTP